MKALRKIFIAVLTIPVLSGIIPGVQAQVLSPYEGATHYYAWSGLSSGASFEFYLTASADGNGRFDDATTDVFDFLTPASGTVESGSELAGVEIRWNTGAAQQSYYLWIEVTEPGGCPNVRYVKVTPRENNRSLAFVETSSAVCFNGSDNGFDLAVNVLDENSGALAESYFPLAVNFTVNEVAHTGTISYNQKQLHVPDSLFVADPMQDNVLVVEVVGVTDKNGAPIADLGGARHTRTIYAQPSIQFVQNLLFINTLSHEENFYPRGGFNELALGLEPNRN